MEILYENSVPSSKMLKEEILTIFAEVTRYPAEILDPDANLEEDLGIDSVKLGEIFSVLREKYKLPNPEELNMPRESLRTISGLADALYQFLATRKIPQTEEAKLTDVTPNGNANVEKTAKQPNYGMDFGNLSSLEAELKLIGENPESTPMIIPETNIGVHTNGQLKISEKLDKVPTVNELKEEILAVFADVTRYPKEILDPEANLEEDLGIDSVKLGEIFSVLREKYRLPDPETLNLPRESLKTINGLSSALHNFLNGEDVITESKKLERPKEIIQQFPVHSNVIGQAIDSKVEVQSEAIKDSFASLTKEKKPFEGKIGFISGSGHGLGKEIAMYLADLGATVIINSFHSRDQGIKTEKEILARNGKVHHIWGSMANPKQLHEIFDEIESQYGYIDFFISNASNGMLAPIEKLEVEHWKKAFMTNVVGLQQGAVRAVKMMKKIGKGKIITLSSPAAHGYVEYFGAMGAVKAAVESFTKAMAVEFAPYNIQVNCVSPGPIIGDLLNKWPESKRLIEQWEEATPYERLCNGSDVAHFIAYLLSDPVKLFTGSILVQDGGISSKGM